MSSETSQRGRTQEAADTDTGKEDSGIQHRKARRPALPGQTPAQVVCDFEPAAVRVHDRDGLAGLFARVEAVPAGIQPAERQQTRSRTCSRRCGSIDRTKFDAARAAASAGRSRAEQQNDSQIDEIQKQIDDLNAEWIRVDQNYQFTKADVRRRKVRIRGSGGAQGVQRRQAASEKSKKPRRQMNEYKPERDEIDTQMQEAKDELAKLQGKSTADRRTNSRRCCAGLRPACRHVLNTLNPGLLVTSIPQCARVDFMNPSERINQILLPNLFYDQPFKQISARGPLHDLPSGNRSTRSSRMRRSRSRPIRIWISISARIRRIRWRQFGCTSCHGGLDRATDFQTAGHTPRRRRAEGRVGAEVRLARRASSSKRRCSR